MKILVTGATGFVGACLTRALLTAGNEVNIFTREKSNTWRLNDVLGNVNNYKVDLRDQNSVESAIATIKPKIIYHCAVYGGFSFQRDTKAIIESNLLGTINLLNACVKTDFDYFINTGSSSEYGIKKHPMKEIDILEPIGDYAVTKAAATLYCQSEALQKKLPIVNLRLFSPYGPWDDPNRFIPYVIKSLLIGEKPQLANPLSVRDYVYIDDVIDLYLNIIKTKIACGSIYNLGTGIQHSIGEVVSKISENMEIDVEPEWGKFQTNKLEPQNWSADIDKTRSELNWNPIFTLDNGIHKTISWFKENIKGE